MDPSISPVDVVVVDNIRAMPTTALFAILNGEVDIKRIVEEELNARGEQVSGDPCGRPD